MRCPNCKHPDNIVDKSIKKENSVIRYRKCLECGNRFKTTELYPYHLKRDLNDVLSDYYDV